MTTNFTTLYYSKPQLPGGGNAGGLLPKQSIWRISSFIVVLVVMGIRKYAEGAQGRPARRNIQILMRGDILRNEDYNAFKRAICFSGKPLSRNVPYCLLIKLMKGDRFMMVSYRQHSFVYSSEQDDGNLTRLFHYVMATMEDRQIEYDSFLDGGCDLLIFDFWPVDVPLAAASRRQFHLDREFGEGVANKQIVSTTSSRGKKLYFRYFGGWNIEEVGGRLNPIIEEGGIKFLEESAPGAPKMNLFAQNFAKRQQEKDKFYRINHQSQFYLVSGPGNTQAGEGAYGKFWVVIVDEINPNISIKRCFNSYGDILCQVTDYLFPRSSAGTAAAPPMKWRRISGNIRGDFLGSELTLYSQNIALTPIKADFKSMVNKGLPLSNIGVIDLETFYDEGGKNGPQAYCYCLGFYTHLDSYKYHTFYINQRREGPLEKDYTDLIHRCVNEMLRDKFSSTVFYSHNFGGFDAPFIIKRLLLFNQEAKLTGGEPYSIETTLRDANVLKLVIKRKIEGKIRKLTICDSYALLPASLRSLCRDYKIKTDKGYFPYEFINKNTLFYVGRTPAIDYYPDLRAGQPCSSGPQETSLEGLRRAQDIYKELSCVENPDNWSTKEECLKYLRLDLKSLYELLVEVNSTVYTLMGQPMTESLTISTLSQRYFLTHHYNSAKAPLPLITKNPVYQDVKEAYRGGRVEVIHPILRIEDKPAYYYDVNSLYPFASLNPMPGTKCTYLERESPRLDLPLESLFGFFYCRVSFEEAGLNIGLLPVKKNNRLIYPTGKWSGWYFSEELKFAARHGYKIEVLKGYMFSQQLEVFDAFVKRVYDMKQNARNGSERNLAKLVLNSLIGRFGMNYEKALSQFVNKEQHNRICTTRQLKSSIQLDDSNFLDTFLPRLDKGVCEDYNLEFVDEIVREKQHIESGSGGCGNKMNNRRPTVSISTAAAVLSYARIHMAKLMIQIIESGGRLYYTDTDSLITDYKFPDEMVDPSALGRLKLEHVLKEGIFIGDKNYAMITESGQVIIKACSIQSDSLTFSNYKQMYKGEALANAVKTLSHRDYSKGSVIIERRQDIHYNSLLYSKRERVFNCNGEWIGTKPLILDE